MISIFLFYNRDWNSRVLGSCSSLQVFISTQDPCSPIDRCHRTSSEEIWDPTQNSHKNFENTRMFNGCLGQCDN